MEGEEEGEERERNSKNSKKQRRENLDKGDKGEGMDDYEWRNKERWGSGLDVYGGKGRVGHRLYIGGRGDKRGDGIVRDKR